MLPRTTAAGLLARRATSLPSLLCYNRSFAVLASRTVNEYRPLPNFSPCRPASTRNLSICRSNDPSLPFYSSPLLELQQFYASSLRPSPFDRHISDGSVLFAKPSNEHPENSKADEKDGTTAPQATDEEAVTSERRAERKAEEGRKEEVSSGEEGKEKSKEDEVRKPSVTSMRAHNIGSRASLIRVQAILTSSPHQAQGAPVLLLDSPYSSSLLLLLFINSASGTRRPPIQKKSPGKNSELPSWTSV